MEIKLVSQLGEQLKAATQKLVHLAGPGLDGTNAHLALQHFVDCTVNILEEQQKRLDALEARLPKPAGE